MYKGQTDARRKANSKYLKDTVDTIAFRVPRGEKEKLKDVAERAGLSLNAFISEAVKEKIEKEGLQGLGGNRGQVKEDSSRYTARA